MVKLGVMLYTFDSITQEDQKFKASLGLHEILPPKYDGDEGANKHSYQLSFTV